MRDIDDELDELLKSIDLIDLINEVELETIHDPKDQYAQ